MKKTYAFDQVTRAIDETFGALLGEGRMNDCLLGWNVCSGYVVSDVF